MFRIDFSDGTALGSQADQPRGPQPRHALRYQQSSEPLQLKDRRFWLPTTEILP